MASLFLAEVAARTAAARFLRVGNLSLPCDAGVAGHLMLASVHFRLAVRPTACQRHGAEGDSPAESKPSAKLGSNDKSCQHQKQPF